MNTKSIDEIKAILNQFSDKALEDLGLEKNETDINKSKLIELIYLNKFMDLVTEAISQGVSTKRVKQITYRLIELQSQIEKFSGETQIYITE